jgi:uncharacterized membrane protein YkvI
MEKLKPALLVLAFYASFFGLAYLIGLGWAMAVYAIGLLFAVPLLRWAGRRRDQRAVSERNRLIEQYFDDHISR